MLKLSRLFEIHSSILSGPEKKNFLILTILFLFSSVFDIIGISSIGYFLLIMMNPSTLTQLPFLKINLLNYWSLPKTLTILGSIILTVFITKTILSCIVQKKLITYCFKVGARLRVQLMEQYLYAPYSYFSSNHTSDIINRVLIYANNYASVCLVAFMTMLVHSIFVSTILIFLLIFNPMVTALLILIFGVMFLIHLFIVRNKLYEAGRKVNSSSQKIVKNVQESMLGLKEVRILSKEEFFINQMRTASEINAEANGFIAVYQRLPFYFLESGMFIFIITLCLAELAMGVKVENIIALCGMLATCGIRLLPSLYQIAVSIITVQSYQQTLEKIHHNIVNFYLDFKNDLPWPKGILQTQDEQNFKTIQFDNISHRYSEAKRDALSQISFTIQKGQSIGIIGQSGAGKSTLMDVALGLLTPTEGRILLDDKPIIDLKSWVKRFAYIPQIIYLLDASIKANIAFGIVESQIDLQKLKHAIKLAQLEEVINNLPQGVDTLVGENGIKLSGGQRQRIALARAFYHEREIIVMDEATSALDNETEKEVVEAIKHLRQLKTLLIIAHRYSTVKHCDIIYRLDKGKVIDVGTFEAVISKIEEQNQFAGSEQVYTTV